MKRITVSGGSGFVGRALVAKLLERGDEVTVLGRDAARARHALDPEGRQSRLTVQSWRAGEADCAPLEAIEGRDAVVQLAGETLVGKRLTEHLRQEARRSRVDSTRALVAAFSRVENQPALFVSGSAVGYYGSLPAEQVVDEGSPPGDDYFARLCREWEAAALAAPAEMRVVIARLGIVFGRDGGALEALVRPFRLFAGGPIGSGRQIVSWIHLEDTARALLHCIDSHDARGPYNVCAPEPASNREIATVLGRVLRRPALLPAPAFALRALFGKDGAAPILEGQRVAPRRLSESGFSFRYPTVSAAIDELLG
ncbi:MAG TPA: TIGR01777 family oxidoreductase [Polyangiaceae bacterium]|nr:TIGR01777 family oxidoreductase [Polyangiaceae bacterium]